MTVCTNAFFLFRIDTITLPEQQVTVEFFSEELDLEVSSCFQENVTHGAVLSDLASSCSQNLDAAVLGPDFEVIPLQGWLANEVFSSLLRLKPA